MMLDNETRMSRNASRGTNSKKAYWMCAKKVRFKTEGHAKQRADYRGMRCYECPLCAGWHLTSIKTRSP